MTGVLWLGLSAPAILVVSFLAGRLLGARRGWVSLLMSGSIGWLVGVLLAGAITDWEWTTFDMVLDALLIGTVAAMAIALALDLIAPRGSLARDEDAGLVTVRNPMAAARAEIAPFRRYREVIGIARREGVLSRTMSHDELPSGVRRTLESAGGIFVKLGQVASTRSDVLPAAWCDQLALLRSSAEPESTDVVRTTVVAELGAPPESVFETFDWTPLASASIAQVFRASVAGPDGASNEVVVKVQRSGLDDTLALDSAAVRQLASLIQRRTPLGLSVQPLELAEEFIEGVEEELDFSVEVANAAELGAALTGLERVRTPVMYPSLSTGRLLVEEFIDAPNIGETDRLVADGHDRGELADRLIDAFLHQLFDAGVFHADPHPGNILVEPDGTIVFIDLGAIGHIGPGHREAVLEMLAAASSGDALLLRHALERVAIFDHHLDTRRLDGAIEAFLARNVRPGGGIQASAFEDLAAMIGQFGIRLPRWFGTLSRTMVSLEGTLTTIDPSFSLVDAAKRHAAARFGDPSPENLQAAMQQEALQQLPRLRRLPERVDEFLGQALSGHLSANVSLLSDRSDARLITRLVDRMVLAVLAAATLIGSVMLLGVDAGPALTDSIRLNEALGYFGLVTGVVLAFRIVAGVVRDGET